eukprot:TRINITY_DN49051_c0_g1_i1.p1 TRINITY_DN49051_c0_g1~~TRINITY_DN49051_c0_g1_i1.p1  ORF type:complete len:561 (+),score=118.89 TRINITY_DN49051_c0_g1_i1:647-2329(+)
MAAPWVGRSRCLLAVQQRRHLPTLSRQPGRTVDGVPTGPLIRRALAGFADGSQDDGSSPWPKDAAAGLFESSLSAPSSSSSSTGRPRLPLEQVPFSSLEGRRRFGEALADGFMENYFHLAEQFRAEDEDAANGLTTMAMVLNSLRIDPMRTWKGAWRWYSEQMIVCPAGVGQGPQQLVDDGLTFASFRTLANCHGAEVVATEAPAVWQSRRGSPGSGDLGEISEAEFTKRFREVLLTITRSSNRECMVACYSRERLGQSGAMQFSPIGGYHARSDSVLIMDVARNKYPPHWVPVQKVVEAMTHAGSAELGSGGWLHMRLQGPELHGDEDLRGPLALPFMPPAAGWRLSTALADKLSTQTPQSNGSETEEAWASVVMGRWLEAASVAEPQVLRQLLQVANDASLMQVLVALKSWPMFTDLCNAYQSARLSDALATVGDSSAEFPPLLFNAQPGPEADDNFSLDTCGELWVVLLLLLPPHLRQRLSGHLVTSFTGLDDEAAQDSPESRLFGESLEKQMAKVLPGAHVVPMEAVRQALALLLPLPDAPRCERTHCLSACGFGR